MSGRSHDLHDLDEDQLQPASGCCSDYVLAPLIIVLVAAGLSFAAIRNPLSGSARDLGPAPAASEAEGVTSGAALSAIFTPEVQHWGEAISAWAAQAQMDPNMVATVMQIESCGDSHALSRSGAIGLFQVMPYHFAADDAPYFPETNATRGLAYLQRALEASNGDPRLTFAGYNGGIGVIARSEWTWPQETVRYAYWGSGIYADAAAGAAESPRLQEWLAPPAAPLRILAWMVERPTALAWIARLRAPRCASAAARSRTWSPAPPWIPP